MDWITSENQQKSQSIQHLLKFDKFTLYDHNFISKINQDDLKFSYIFNCKRLNKKFSTICKVEGDLKYGQIQISCSLVDQFMIVSGIWQYQKIELIKFANRYNQKATQNISLKINPINGQMFVSINFMINPILAKQTQKFKQIITDYCKLIGQESQKIFNTIIILIFYKQADQPYLKSSKTSSDIPPQIKISKLLDKIKTLILTSNHYKLKKDISTAHKNRSSFKKIYLTQNNKIKNQPKILERAKIYQPKFHRKYQQGSQILYTQIKGTQYIKKYQQIQQKYQIQFAKYLPIEKSQKQQISLKLKSIYQIQVLGIQGEIISDVNSMIPGDKIVITSQKKIILYMEKVQQSFHTSQLSLLNNIIKQKHPNIVQYYCDKKFMNIRFTQGKTIKLQEYLQKYSDVLSLQTKIQIMKQLCDTISYLHDLNIAYLITMDNILIGQDGKVKIRDLTKAWNIKQQEYKNYTFIQFPYINIKKQQMLNQKCDTYSLAMVLYKIIMGKFPFSEDLEFMNRSQSQNWEELWVVQTEYFLRQGGQIIKILGNLLLKCANLADINKRAYVEWITVVIHQIKHWYVGHY